MNQHHATNTTNINNNNNGLNFDDDLEHSLEEKLCFHDSGNASLESRKENIHYF